MKISVILVLVVCIATVFADKMCTHVSKDGEWYYDFSSLKSGNPYLIKGDAGKTYYVTFCDDFSDNTDPSIQCAASSAVCMQDGKTWTNLGDLASRAYLDSESGTDKGVKITYSAGICASDPLSRYSSLLVLNCSYTDEFVVVNATTSGCSTKMFINTKYVCPLANIYEDDNHDHHRHSHRGASVAGFILLALGVCCLCLCCTCCIRGCRKHCRANGGACCKKTSYCNRRGDYTAVEMVSAPSPAPQPINPSMPQQAPFVPYYMVYPHQVPNGQPLPAYAPPMYMPAPQNVATPAPQQAQAQQIVSDEEFARQLQEQLNKE